METTSPQIFSIALSMSAVVADVRKMEREGGCPVQAKTKSVLMPLKL